MSAVGIYAPSPKPQATAPRSRPNWPAWGLVLSNLVLAGVLLWSIRSVNAEHRTTVSTNNAIRGLRDEAEAAVDQLVLHNARSAALLSKAEKFAREF